MENERLQRLQKVFSRFDVPEKELIAEKECLAGHISHTYFVTADSQKRYVLQEMNEYVFPNIDLLMNNIMLVTSFIREKSEDKDRSTLYFRKTKEGKNYYRDEDGNPWRMYDLVEGVRTYDICPNPSFFKEVGRSFGNFANQLSDFDATLLGEVIPDFHNTLSRLEQLKTAIQNDCCGRVKEVQPEIDFVFQREKLCGKIVKSIEEKKIPLRVTHNDTKLNNILIDNETDKGICIIDLDTVMPGSILYDFGDAIRSGATTAMEDDPIKEHIHIDLEKFSAFTEGYLGELKDSLTEEEINLMPESAIIITLETGIRFLTDYLNGDKYFHIERPTQNADRARNQFYYVADMERNLQKMTDIVTKQR